MKDLTLKRQTNLNSNLLKSAILVFCFFMVINPGLGEANKSKPPQITGSLIEGDIIVKGKGEVKSKIKIFIGNTLYNKDNNPFEIKDKEGKFEIELKKPLKLGEKVKVIQTVEIKNGDKTYTNELQSKPQTVIAQPIKLPIYEGQTVIRGRFQKKDNIQIELQKKENSGAWKTMTEKPKKRKYQATKMHDGSSGIYSFILEEPLKSGQWLNLKIGKREFPVFVNPSPIIHSIVKEGGTGIEVTLKFTQKTRVKCEAFLMRDDNSIWAESKVLPEDTQTDRSNANLSDRYKFDLKFENTLRDGDNIILRLLDIESNREIINKKIPVFQTGIDWGRVRLALSYGVHGIKVFDIESGNLKGSGKYLEFLVHIQWKKIFRKPLWTYVNVLMQSQEQAINDSEETQTQHYTKIELGAYYPFSKTDDWVYNGKKTSLFVALIGKFGVEYFNGIQPNWLLFMPDAKQGYPYFYGGLRLGHFIKSNTKDQAPWLLSYVDLTIGQSQSVGTIRDTAPLNLGILDDKIKQSLNYQIEARIIFRRVPFTIGCDWLGNLTKGDIPDYIRFKVGARLDLFSLLDKILTGK